MKRVLLFQSIFQDHRCGLSHKENADHVKLDRTGILSEKNHKEDLSSAIEMVASLLI